MGYVTETGFNSDGQATVTVAGVELSSNPALAYLLANSGQWRTTKMFPDADGNVTVMVEGATSGARATTTMIFDAFGDDVETIHPLGFKTYQLFDADGQQTATISGVADQYGSR